MCVCAKLIGSLKAVIVKCLCGACAGTTSSSTSSEFRLNDTKSLRPRFHSHQSVTCESALQFKLRPAFRTRTFYSTCFRNCCYFSPNNKWEIFFPLLLQTQAWIILFALSLIHCTHLRKPFTALQMLLVGFVLSISDVNTESVSCRRTAEATEQRRRQKFSHRVGNK